MIVALGADLVEIARVERLLSRHGERALRRLFHEEEVAYALARQNPFPSLAAVVSPAQIGGKGPPFASPPE